MTDSSEKRKKQAAQAKATEKETTRAKIDRIASIIMKLYTYRTINGDTGHEILMYDRNARVYGSEHVKSSIKILANALLEGKCNPQDAKDVIEQVALRTDTKSEEFDAFPNVVVCGNGYLNLDTLELDKTVDENRLFRRSITADFDPDATCPHFEEFLEKAVQPPDARLIKQFLGYMLMPDNRFKKALIFVGRAHSGKTTCSNVFRTLVGENNYEVMTLQQICNDQFMVNKLAGKVANICSELPRGKINDPDLFKSLTGGDPVHGRIFYGTGSKFINTAKFLFACNEVPYVPEADAAYKERFIVISFNRIYEPGAPGTIANFSDLLVGELSGILNLAIIGRLELLANNGFAIDPHCVSFRNDYDTYTGSSVLPFAAACLFVGPDFHAAKSTVYHYYEKYCAHQRVDVLTESAFWLELKKALKKEKIKESRPRGVAPKLDDDMEQGVDLGDGGANSRYIDIKGIGINQNFLAGL